MLRKLTYLCIWSVIFFLAIVGYSYWHELSAVKNRVMAELLPGKGFQGQPDSMSFPIGADGHFHIRAVLDGTSIDFMVDTGASHIMLSPGDARKLGIRLSSLRFDRIYATANGRVAGALVRIDDFRVGNMHLKDVTVSVNRSAMNHSLLGMSFFKRLARYEVHADILTLFWK